MRHSAKAMSLGIESGNLYQLCMFALVALIRSLLQSNYWESTEYRHVPVSLWNISKSVGEVLRVGERWATGLGGASGMKMATSSARITRIAPNANGGPGMIVYKQTECSIIPLIPIPI
jgi:hypothetical protein